MDKIWVRNPSKSEVIGRCGGDEKPNDHAEPTKVKAKKKKKKGLQNVSQINIPKFGHIILVLLYIFIVCIMLHCFWRLNTRWLTDFPSKN